MHFRQPQLITGMGTQRILGGERDRHLLRQIAGQTALTIDLGEFSELHFRFFRQFTAFPGKVGTFGVGLARDRDILTCGHRHRASYQSSHPGNQDRCLFRR